MERTSAEKPTHNETVAGDTWSLLTDPRHDIEFQTRYASDCLSDFAQREHDLAKQGAKMSDQELLTWEKDFAEARHKLYQAEQKAPDFGTADLTATEAQLYRGCRPEETIDARVGRFYGIRARALNQAIAAGADPHGPDSDLTRDFFHAVMDHVINYRYPSIKGMDGFEYENFLRRRRSSHDRVIKTLNRLNKLAEQYGTERFTPSQFQDGNLYDVSARYPFAEACANMHRDIVEAYYSEAFSSDIAKVEHEHRYDY